MEIRQQLEYDFDAEKVMGMTREEAISLLGEENAKRVNDGLKNGTLTYGKFESICQEKFPIPQQAKLVRNVIFNQLSQTEGFNMFETNKKKQAEYAKIAYWRDKAEKGELTRDELKQLCDKVFGEDSGMSKKIQEELVTSGKVKKTDTRTESSARSEGEKTSQEKKSWELKPEQKIEIQKNSAMIAQEHRKQEEQQRQNQSKEIEQGQNRDNMQQIEQPLSESQQNNELQQIPAQPQQPMMDMGGMEL